MALGLRPKMELHVLSIGLLKVTVCWPYVAVVS